MPRFWWFPGVMLIGFGLAILIFPRLLELLVATAFISAGLGALAWSRSMGGMFSQMQNFRVVTRPIHVDDFYRNS